MVWGAITYQGVGKLVFVEGRMDSEQYINILSSGYLQSLYMDGFDMENSFLQQDNDPKHKSRRTMEFIDRAGMNVLPWPSCSPDLNIIEHVWNDVEVRLRKRLVQPTNISSLKVAIEEEWYSTTLYYIRALYNSIPRRLEAVKKAKGGYTKY